MGIPKATARFLIEAKHWGVSFERTATVGRQHLMVGPRQLARTLRQAGLLKDTEGFYRSLEETLWYADPLFHVLGTTELAAIDISDYEGATIIADLNEPVPQDLHERFSLLFDGGSLEHIFHAPTALQNYMEMVQIGGHLLITAPGNNLFGHGLYQFGPDFFYRSLCADNGFRIERAMALVQDVDAPARFLGKRILVDKTRGRYRMADPAEVGDRVQIVGRQPVVLMIQAQRVERMPIFAVPPQQSDYSARWADHREEAPPVDTAAVAKARHILSPRAQLHLMLDVLPRFAPLLDPLRGLRERRRRSLRNRQNFRRT